MAPELKRTLRCAIYTRKSSEEGLEQEFNSLHAQREACEAFIASQRHEGWRVVGKHYDDGGFSGGSIERPGIQELLQDVHTRQVDVVVVYKVDRLTRSLSDFAKLVEAFDANEVSFVSVTQQFNTTSSMGRLTLNILLSFAQFEREVTGERIRDKFAASRKKGLWMGGNIPLGYDLKDRKLVINKKEAEQVRTIFETYLRVRCVRKLKQELDAGEIRTKSWTTSTGTVRGSRTISRGSLYNLLRNRLYLGEAVHKGKANPGEHRAIITPELWNAVQNTLERNSVRHQRRTDCVDPSLLAGLVVDAEGNRFSPTHTSRRGRRYRYYVNQAVLQHKATGREQISRLPAHELEEAVCKSVTALLADEGRLSAALRCDLSKNGAAMRAKARAIGRGLEVHTGAEHREFIRSLVEKIQVAPAGMEIFIKTIGLAKLLDHSNGFTRAAHRIRLTVPVPLMTRQSQFKIVSPSGDASNGGVQVSLLKAVARAHGWWNELLSNPENTIEAIAKRSGTCQRFVSQTLKLAFIYPEYVEMLVAERALTPVAVRKLMCGYSADWAAQRDEIPLRKARLNERSDGMVEAGARFHA